MSNEFFWTFWSGILVILIPQVAMLIHSWIEKRSQRKITEAQAKDVLGGALGDALTKLGEEYSRMLLTHRALQDEVNSLRPLTLKLALLQQDYKQSKEDKEDWKRYSERLAEQLQDHGLIPAPFRRLPSNGDSDKHKKVVVEKTTKEILKNVLSSETAEDIITRTGELSDKRSSHDPPSSSDKDR